MPAARSPAQRRSPPLGQGHGLAVSHRWLMPLAAELAGHHPVHVVDLPGFGLSATGAGSCMPLSTPTTWPTG
jgi:pimeloyl-ACP methyl ester carboxylesterase